MYGYTNINLSFFVDDFAIENIFIYIILHISLSRQFTLEDLRKFLEKVEGQCEETEFLKCKFNPRGNIQRLYLI